MLRIQELDFREDSDDVLIQGGARAHVSGFAQSGNGYAVATIGSSASGSFTSTTAFTSTSAVQSASLGYSSAHAFGRCSHDLIDLSI